MALTDNLVAYYKFDNNSNDVTWTNDWTDTNMSYSTSTKLLWTHSADFASASSKINLPANILSNIATWNYTINVWLYISSHTVNWAIYTQSANNQSDFILYRVNSWWTITWFYRDWSVSDQHLTTTTTTVPTWAWSMVTISVNWDWTDPTIYINGSVASIWTQTTTWSPLTPTTTRCNIGILDRITTDNDYRDYMDWYWIRTRTLSSSEVTELYNGGAWLQYPFTTANTTNFFFMM